MVMCFVSDAAGFGQIQLKEESRTPSLRVKNISLGDGWVISQVGGAFLLKDDIMFLMKGDSQGE
jgi:hypothetical protein